MATTGKTVPGKPVVEGGLDTSVIRRVVRRHRNEIRSCYEKELTNDPELAGRVTLDFTIDSTGKVEAASVGETTLKAASVGTCMVESVKKWTFPEPDGGGKVTVSHPFNFSN